MLCKLDSLLVELNSDASSYITKEGELDEITTDTATCIEDNSILDMSHKASCVNGDGLWCHWKPAFIINLHSRIISAEKEVSLLVELLKLLRKGVRWSSKTGVCVWVVPLDLCISRLTLLIRGFSNLYSLRTATFSLFMLLIFIYLQEGFFEFPRETSKLKALTISVLLSWNRFLWLSLWWQPWLCLRFDEI